MKKRFALMLVCALLVFTTACNTTHINNITEATAASDKAEGSDTTADRDTGASDTTDSDTPPPDTDGEIKMTEQDFQNAINYIKQCRAEGKLSYSAFAVGNRQGEFFHWTLDGTNDTTIFNMASVTKITVTTTLFLIAQSEGLLHWDDKLGDHMNAPSDKADIPLWRFMSHSSGLKAYNVSKVTKDPTKYFNQILSDPLAYETGTKVLYSCNGFNLIGHIIEQTYGKTLDELFIEKIATPLGMKNSGYKLYEKTTDIAKHTNSKTNIVIDGNCYLLGSVSGNAGLFSDIVDMSTYAVELSNGLPSLIPHDLFEESLKNRTVGMNESRAIGWNLVDENYTQTGRLFPNGAYGHTGHQGTSIFVDSETGLWVVWLTNATYFADDYSEVKKMREYFHNAVADDLNLYVEEVVPDTDGTLVIGGPNKKEDYGALVTPK